MKKTLNINLAGYPFTIDEDAYNLLKDYLDTIRYAFETNDDTGEIASDIESRIAELLINNEAGGVRIVSREEISNVIERIGKPSEFIEIDETVEMKEDMREEPQKEEEIKIEEEKITPPPYNAYQYSKNPFVRKKIFRDPENAILGGVCAGISHYLHVDVTIVRLITVVLFFLSATTVAIAYIILWIIIPEARSPWQRMMMMGENPTVENIGKTVTENYEKPSYAKERKGGIDGFLYSAFSVIVKAFIIIGLIIAAPVLLALAIGLLGCCIAVLVIGVAMMGGVSDSTYGMFNSSAEGLMVLFILLAVIGGIITLGIPLWLFVRTNWKKKDTEPNPNNRRVLLVVWLCGIAMLAVFTVRAVKQSHKIDRYEITTNYERLREINELNDNSLEKIVINKDSVVIETNNGKNFSISKGKVSIDTIYEEQKYVTATDTTDFIVNIKKITDLDTIKQIEKQDLGNNSDSVK